GEEPDGGRVEQPAEDGGLVKRGLLVARRAHRKGREGGSRDHRRAKREANQAPDCGCPHGGESLLRMEQADQAVHRRLTPSSRQRRANAGRRSALISAVTLLREPHKAECLCQEYSHFSPCCCVQG